MADEMLAVGDLRSKAVATGDAMDAAVGAYLDDPMAGIDRRDGRFIEPPSAPNVLDSPR